MKDGTLSEERSRISSDTFSFLREKLEYNQEKGLKLKKEERTEVPDAMIQQQSQSNEVLRIFTKQSQANS